MKFLAIDCICLEVDLQLNVDQIIGLNLIDWYGFWNKLKYYFVPECVTGFNGLGLFCFVCELQCVSDPRHKPKHLQKESPVLF